ncbi:MAG: hypothetical protein F4Z91_04705 [Acidimicrobiia bacterium]|nr:hypothetical protein [Acidimicrobiia bacterium]
MVAETSKALRSVTAWPVSLRWRLLAVLLVLAATTAAIFLLSLERNGQAEILVVATTERWLQDHPVGEHTLIPVPAGLASLFVQPDDLKNKAASVDIPEGSLVAAQMLRSHRSSDNERATALMAFVASASMWPSPGPAAGDPAVFASSPGGCATAIQRLVAVEDEGAAMKVTLEVTPELAEVLADREWWIWQSPPSGWPQCEIVLTDSGEGEQ